jgi:hypothetical protein
MNVLSSSEEVSYVVSYRIVTSGVRAVERVL